MTIKTKAKNLSSIIFLTFILILPVFGKGIDRQESFIFFGLPVLFALQLISSSSKITRTPHSKYQILLTFLYILSVVFSISIGNSYYSLFYFLATILIFNLSFNFISSDNQLQTGMVVASVIYSIVTIFYKFYLVKIVGNDFSDNIFIQTWGHSYSADFLILTFPILLSKISSKKPIYLPLTILTSIAIITTNSRSALLALIVALAFIPSPSRFQKTYRLISVVGFTVALAYIFLFSTVLKSPSGSRPEYWSQAISGFISSPLFGVGPGNFGIINRQYRHDPINSTNYAHNSLLESLAGNGLPFTLVAFSIIGYGLWFQYKHHRLYFTVGLASIINSFFDPTWSSPGILILTLIIIFWKVRTYQDQYLIKTTSILTTIFFTSKLISDLVLIKGTYQTSLFFDPFNPNAIMKDVKSNLNRIKLLYRQDPDFLKVITTPDFLPENEEDFYRVIQSDPYGSANHIFRLSFYYNQNNNYPGLKRLTPIIYSRLRPEDVPLTQSLELAKSAYLLGLSLWNQGDTSSAIYHLQKSVEYSKGWSHFKIELAQVYWHTGDKDRARQIIDDCQKEKSSSQHCQEFQTKVSTSNWPLPGNNYKTISKLFFAQNEPPVVPTNTTQF